MFRILPNHQVLKAEAMAMSDAAPLQLAADRNLLFGILALQMDFISRDALVAGMNAWVLDKAKPLGRILVDQGALKENAYALLNPLVQAHLCVDGADTQESLVAVSSLDSDVEAEQAVAEADVQTRLAQVSGGRHESDASYAAKAPSMGVPTSTGLRFRVLRPDDKGGVDEVSVVRDEELPCEAALEQIEERHADELESPARFALEAEMTGGREHTGIVPVDGPGSHADGRPFYATRSIRGDNLKEVIKRFHEQEQTSGSASVERQLPDVADERNVQFRQLLRRFIDVSDAAIKLQEETVALMMGKLGPDHPSTLASSLATSYAALGRHADAIKLFEETLKLRKDKLGPDHPDTLNCMNNLATSYSALGRHADVLKLFEEKLKLIKAKLVPHSPSTLASMNSQATSHPAPSRHADALKLRDKTLTLRKAKLRPGHAETLKSLNNLAVSHVPGRHADALTLNEETLALRRAKLGPDHHATLRSMNNLAISYKYHGRYADALNLYEETLKLRKAKSGPDHPDTLWSMGNLAAGLIQLERGSEAVPVIDECVRRANGDDVDPQLVPAVIDLRLRHFEKTKDGAGCRQTAVMWEGLKRTDANSLYSAACFRAVTAAVVRAADHTPVGIKQAEAEADQAMAWLKKAVAAGYKDVAHMEKDKDLDALRDREDFKKLLVELKAGPGVNT
jgi:tetratricopeptide (TPR) repeat protein